jgi:hypothetical protein
MMGMALVSNGGPPLHVRYFEVTRYGRTIRHRIDPGAYRCSELAAELADRYEPVHREMPQSAERVVVGIRAFLRWICTQPDPLPCSLAEVTAAHLRRWERWLGQRQQAQRSHSAYDKFVNFRALLLRIAHDKPLATHPSLRLLLASPTVTVLPEMRPAEGLPPFSRGEHRQIIAASYREVAAALDLAHNKSHEELAQRMGLVLTALHILLSAGSGEPPEVLRNVRLSDIRPLVPGAEVDAPGGEARAGWLQEVVRARPSGYCLQLRKLRSHTLYDTFITRRDRYSCFAIEASVRITGPFRREGSSDALWIDERGRHAVFTDRSRLSNWLTAHAIDVDGAKSFSRFRKAVVGAEAMADPAAYLATARRHRAPTFFRSYKNNPVLRAHSGRALVGAISKAFEEAIQPTVLTSDSLADLQHGELADGAQLSADEQRALLNGEMEGPHAACRDPLHSPFGRQGETCGSSASGLCFVCPNAVITERHLPALVFFAHHLDPERAGDIEVWQTTWEPVWSAITKGILPRFDSKLVAKAMVEAQDVYVDIGVRQDLGPLEVEP